MNYETILVAIIAAVPPTVASVLSHRSIHRQFNARMDEYIRMVSASSRAEGKLEGRSERGK
jgi:hypothetical protein